MGFQRMLGMVCSKYLPGGLHGCEGAAISVKVARAVWSKKLPMTNTLALLGWPLGICSRLHHYLESFSAASTISLL